MTDDELRAMLEAATPGPWEADYDNSDEAQWYQVGPARVYFPWSFFGDVEIEDRAQADATLIAAAPDLAAEVLRLRAFIRDFAETDFPYYAHNPRDPQDELDPLTDYLMVDVWQSDARDILKGGA